ncbi:hypothetical protein O3M35_009975 [Rhynocoris fuscipes]|uniref:Cuticle protein n=1 Tax=Rhynocoris fuscipes TaxID=488301 RepID=A0AAW1CZJ1_9HEMI
MISFLLQIILALTACIYAAEEEQRVKKDVIVGTIPYAYQSVYPYAYNAYDYPKYYPAAAVTAYHAPTAVLQPAALHTSAYSTHAVHPLPYQSYPYQTYPLVKSYIY